METSEELASDTPENRESEEVSETVDADLSQSSQPMSQTEPPPEIDQPDPVFYKFRYTQTPKYFYDEERALHIEEKPRLDAKGATLLHQYHHAVDHYIQNVNTQELSELRAEIVERLKKRAIYQQTSYGSSKVGFDEAPPNLFNTFTVSLYLIIDHDQFIFSSAVPGFQYTGSLNDDEGLEILYYISQGLIVPGILKQLKQLHLTWYDGCLICEILDNRRKFPKTVRTQLRVHPNDVASFGFEAEQQFLLIQTPHLCLDPNPQVANVARIAMQDRQRWEPSHEKRESTYIHVSRDRPEIFIRRETPSCMKPVTQEQENSYREAMISKLLEVSSHV